MKKSTIASLGFLALVSWYVFGTYHPFERFKETKTEDLVNNQQQKPTSPTALDGDTAERQDFANYQPQEPVVGGSCKDLENYFNRNFGRSDTQFSNAEGTIQGNTYSNGVEMSCNAVIITTYPTGKKTCSGLITYIPNAEHKLIWFVSDKSTDCFVS